ncbi:PREDICTED: uncharacterized protein LOC104753391 [Camelina sativa]|uniref:Uncharacterized protein LOC104753391 n=1 Tax=Camelina sativa TaxID=90675 RepID=A0ABM0WP28_CAMSA|nr:PREDICTED: uncharacterized protein LOC104753391 [Camelina sativa]
MMHGDACRPPSPVPDSLRGRIPDGDSEETFLSCFRDSRDDKQKKETGRLIVDRLIVDRLIMNNSQGPGENIGSSSAAAGSYSRVKAHLLGIKNVGILACKKVRMSEKVDMQRLENEFEERKKESGKKEVSLPCETNYAFKKRKSSFSPIERAFGIAARDQLDQEIARMFYTGGVAFNLARNPHYHRSYQFAAATNIDGYVPPGYNKLRTTLLQKERNHVESLLVPLKSTWNEKGVSIVSDGWSDPTRKPLINFISVSGNAPLFMKAVDCAGEVKDKFFISNLMKEVINEVGHQKIVQIITDNAANCKAAGEIIECTYPHIYWTPCVVHTLNLALKNICAARNVESNSETYDACNWITNVHGDALAIKHFIMNHSMILAIFSKFSPLKLLAVVDTRFASIVVMLKRLKLIKTGLQSMVISEQWSTYRDDDIGKANFVKEKLLDDDWWDKVTYIIDFARPIYDMIRYCDTNKPCLHLVYEMWDSMIEKVKAEIYKKEGLQGSEYSLFFDVVYDILVARWAKNNTPLHCLAHSLNPRMKCFQRLFPSSEDHTKVMNEYALFSTKSGHFQDLICILGMENMEPMNWWVNFGAKTPLLQTLAFRLLGQPSSSSCAERNWSTYSFIHSLRRNRLTTSRAEDLVYIHNNLRLLSRNTDEYQNEKTKQWDVGGDESDIQAEAGIMELSNLSLDDPDFENQFLNN